MPSLIALALTCHLSTMNRPEYYTAKINGPLRKNNYSMVLTSHFYGAALDYQFNLLPSNDGLFGKDKNGDEAVVKDMVQTKTGMNLTIEATNHGTLQMICQ